MRFDQLPLNPTLAKAIKTMGFVEATPIQDLAIIPMMEGRDVVGQARTGSGKTAAFGIPLVEALGTERRSGIHALILVPTRELAIQVTDVLVQLTKGTDLNVIPIYGGVGFGKQLDGLNSRKPIILIATPGRLLDHVQRGTARLENVEFLVLDEADRMLDMGFIHDMKKILKIVPKKRQTALFSATVAPEVRKLIGDFTRDPLYVEADTGETTPLVDQEMAWVGKDFKLTTLYALLAEEQPKRAIVFTRTKHVAKRVAQKLGEHGWRAVPLQGNMSQSQRERAMDAFRTGQARIMVATDVAARGIDVPEIELVINYDLPDAPEQYVHRVGRTARAGRGGKAVTFVQNDEKKDLMAVEKQAGLRLPNRNIKVVEPVARGPDQGMVELVPKGPEQRAPSKNRRRPGVGNPYAGSPSTKHPGKPKQSSTGAQFRTGKNTRNRDDY